MTTSQQGLLLNPHDIDELRKRLTERDVIAFVGAGASYPIYPLWSQVLAKLLDALEQGGQLNPHARAFLTSFASSQPQSVATYLSHALDDRYFAILRRMFEPNAASNGKGYTDVHDLLMRLPFRGYVTTNYDNALSLARAAADPKLGGESVGSWDNPQLYNDWASRAVFEKNKKPILHLHGQHEHIDSVILCEKSYARAYGVARNQGIPGLLEQILTAYDMLFVGFSFSDPWQNFIIKDVASRIPAANSEQRRRFILTGVPREDTSIDVRRRIMAQVYRATPIFYPIDIVRQSDGSTTEDHRELTSLLEVLGARPKEPHGDPPFLRQQRTEVVYFRDGTPALKFSILPQGRMRISTDAGERMVTFGSAFGMSQTVVPASLFQRFLMQRHGAAPRAELPDDLPATSVRWADAQAFANWLGALVGRRLRLPSEAEWEYAARAGTPHDYWFGRDPDLVHIRCRETGATAPLPAGSGTANPWGLFHMHGNVWEWVQDTGRGNQRHLPSDGRPLEIDLNFRILKGGSFLEPAERARAWKRRRVSPLITSPDVGFRLVLETTG